MAEIIFDDIYTGARWVYGLSFRPLGYAGVPVGWIVFSDRKHSQYKYGTVDYPRQLTPEEVVSYELEELTSN